MRASDLSLLAAPFDTSDVEWKPGAVTRDKTKGLAMAYLSNRAVQDRLDAVCGPADWRNEYRPGPDGGVVCGLSVYVERDSADGTSASAPEWVTKWDGADNTDVEAVKGGLSGSMKRAAVMWGIGRSLYGLPAQWVRLDERGRFAEPPRLPAGYGRDAAPARPVSAPAPRPAAVRSEASPEARPEAPRPQRTEGPRPDAQGRSEAPQRPNAPQGDAPRPGPPDARGRVGQQRIVRPAPGRPGEGDGGSRVVDPGF